ncbi:MAG: Omp28-related outer membrane protein [Prevotella sp.]|nr:Omp28-related outer membrane protein [Prevotella sp.]
MKKVFLFAAACLLTLGVSAQVLVSTNSDAVKAMKSPKAAGQMSSVKKAPSKALGDNQYYCGFYTTDEIAQYGSGMGNYYSGASKAAQIFGSDTYGDFTGFKVVGMRVALWCDVQDFGVFVSTVSGNSFVEKVSKTVGQGAAGWNTVMFDTSEQFELPADGTEYLVGFDYLQKNTSSNDSYPMSILDDQPNYDYIYWYGNIPASYGGSGLGWYTVGTGTLSVQLIVEGELPDQRVIIGALTTDGSFFKNGDNLPWHLAVTNMGNTPITSLQFDAYIDGTLTGNYNVSLNIAPTASADATSTLPISTSLSVGKHTLKMVTTGVNGAAPTSQVEGNDKTTSFSVYTASVARQKHLIEHITSWTCTYCYLGYNVLRKMESDYNDIAWVAVHGNQSSQTDPYYFATCDQIMSFLNVSGFPSAAFNRAFISELAEGESTLAYGLGYNASYINQVVPYLRGFMEESAKSNPSFVTIAIGQSYDAASRKLDITVSGTGVEAAAQLLSDYKINVYITEEGLKGRQYSNGTWQNNYEHNNTLRAVLTNVMGDDITWDGDNFTYTTSYTVPSSYVVENLSITAFVAPRPGDIYHMTVNNCERVAVDPNATGITTVNQQSSSDTRYYTIDSKRIDAPVKGVNIVKCSDGSTRKVVIK